MVKLHGKFSLPLSDRPQLRGVAKHPPQRHQSLHNRAVATQRLCGDDRAFSVVDGLESQRLELAWIGHLHSHDWLQHDRSRLWEGLPEGSFGSRLEGNVGRIDLMGGPILHNSPEVDNRVTSQVALRARLLEALVNRWNVVGRDGVAIQSALKEDVLWRAITHGVFRHRLNETGNLSVLTSTSRLPFVQVVIRSLLCDGLPVVDFGLSGLQVNPVLSTHALAIDVEMQLTHAGDDGLL
mmetsp:Transcript_54465/g.129819  ORF Transcript_54465/g.129819 Transcript_54465/m.129819 type:complete len:238 (-) Transcript_54465:1584-2297(-)